MTIPRTAPTGSDHSPADVEAHHPPQSAGAPAAAYSPPGGAQGEVPSLSAIPPGAREGTDAIVIPVYGTPAPQGSKRHMGHGVLVESSEKVKPWREAVKWAALAHFGHRIGRAPLRGPLTAEITFTLARPKNHYRTGRNSHLLRDAAPAYPSGKPDIDKLLRSTFDGLSEAGIWGDDAQVVDSHERKVYPGTEPDALEVPGAVIRVQQIDVKAPATREAS